MEKRFRLVESDLLEFGQTQSVMKLGPVWAALDGPLIVPGRLVVVTAARSRLPKSA